MKKRLCLRLSVFLLLFMSSLSCQDTGFEEPIMYEDFTPVGKAFMSRLENSPDGYAGWKAALRKGKILANEAVLLYGGGYGWHYVLPLTKEDVVSGVVIFPIKDIGKNELPVYGQLDYPIVRVGSEAIQDIGAGGFLNTPSFTEWKEHGLKITEELQEAQYKWRENISRTLVPATRSSAGYFYCFYELRFENYIDEDGMAVIVGMTPSHFEDICYDLDLYLPHRLDRLEVTDEYIYLECTELEMQFYMNKLKEWLEFRHTHLMITYIWGRTEYGYVYGGYQGGGGGGGSGSGHNEKVAPIGELSKAIFNNDSKLTEAQWDKVEEALEYINNDCMGGKLITALKDKNISIVHDESITANGFYNHEHKRVTIKDFKEKTAGDRTFERTLYHELLHSQQTGDTLSKLNQEIEVRVAVYKYVEKYGISLGAENYKAINALALIIDKNYNITDLDAYDKLYSGAIKELKEIDGYKDYRESPTARNFDTAKRLAKDC